jgi:hypothetical protein
MNFGANDAAGYDNCLAFSFGKLPNSYLRNVLDHKLHSIEIG